MKNMKIIDKFAIIENIEDKNIEQGSIEDLILLYKMQLQKFSNGFLTTR